MSCAKGYGAVAAQHGATRRDFIKMGLGALAVVAGAGALVNAGTRPAEATDYTYDWQCAFGTWYIVERACNWIWIPTIGPVGGWVYECMIISINDTGWSC